MIMVIANFGGNGLICEQVKYIYGGTGHYPRPKKPIFTLSVPCGSNCNSAHTVAMKKKDNF